jgi:uncharacterized protein YjiS (DUF1127 family)
MRFMSKSPWAGRIGHAERASVTGERRGVTPVTRARTARREQARTRAELSELSDHLLKDLGLQRAAIRSLFR